MASSCIPGPLGLNSKVTNLDDGTLVRQLSEQPGPTCAYLNQPFKAHPSFHSVMPAFRRKHSQSAIKVLQQGDRGPEVQQLQRLLNVRLSPCAGLEVDGTFGPDTSRVVTQYQRGVSLISDGIVGKQTWFHLLKGDKATISQGTVQTAEIFDCGISTAPEAEKGIHPRPQNPQKAVVTDILEWTLEDKFAATLRRATYKLRGSLRQEFEALLSAKSIGAVAGSCVLWAGSHAFGVGEIIDIVLLIGGLLSLGAAVFEIADDLRAFLILTSTATENKDLDDAASHLARALAIMEVAAFTAVIARVARCKVVRGRGPETLKVPAPATPKSSTAQSLSVSKTLPKKDIFILDQEGVPIGARKELAKPGLPANPLSKEGWPDLPASEARNFTSAEPVTLKPGTKIFRIIDDSSNPAGGYWSEQLPDNRAGWRGEYAVKTEWNTNGKYVEYTVPSGSGLNAWRGETAPQQLQGSDFYLPGGGQQIWVPPSTLTPSLAKPIGW